MLPSKFSIEDSRSPTDSVLAVRLIAASPPIEAQRGCENTAVKQAADGYVGCSHVDRGIPADGAAKIYDSSLKSAAGRNVICGDVHRGVRADRSWPVSAAVEV